jgi:hypothetical protein
MTWSNELWRILGLEFDAAVASYDAFLDAVHPEDRPRVATALNAAVHDGAPYTELHRG